MERRLDGLGDAPRPGATRKITDEQVEVLVTRTLTEKGHRQDSHCSTRSMAAETGLSQSSVSRIWRAFGLKPHVVETWKLGTDPELSARSAVPPALHADQLQLDEPGRALVRRAVEPQAAPASPPQRHRARDRHPQVDQRVEQEPEAVRVDQDRRRGLETLAAYCQPIIDSGR
jgi:transposase